MDGAFASLAALWQSMSWIDAAIVLPEVAGYSSLKVELIAAVRLRDALEVRDGGPVMLEVSE